MKRHGRIFIAAAIAFITFLTGYDPIAIPGSVISSILLAIGMSGLRSSFGESISPTGSRMLGIGILGPVVWVFGFPVMAILGMEAMEQGSWVLLFVGPAVSLSGLFLFGITALRSKPMPRLNWLPLFAGIWYPVAYTVTSVYLISQRGEVAVEALLPTLVLMVIVQFFALCLFGTVLINDSPK